MPLQEIKDIRSSIHDPSGTVLRVSVEDIQVRHAQLLGPLRLGFLHSIEARGVSVDTFDEHSPEHPGSSAAIDVTRAVNSLLPANIRKGVVHADIERVRLTRHEAGHPVFTLAAHRCATTTEHNRVVCWNGSVTDGGTTTGFREAVFSDAGRCTIDGASLVLSAR
jgi:hypothetical protein